MCQFKYTKQEAADDAKIQRGVRAGMRAHFAHIVMLAIFFWNIWREMSYISLSDDADCACRVPNSRQQNDDNFRDYFDAVKSFHEHFMLCFVPYSLWMTQ